MAEPVQQLERPEPSGHPAASADAVGAANVSDAADPTAVAGVRRVLVSAVSLLFAYVLPRLATFAAVVVAARVVGVAAFGAYGTAAALAVILSITATLGMMQMLVRDLAQRPGDAPELMAAANVAKAASGLFMMAALAVLAAWVLDYPPRVVAAALLLGASYAAGGYVENLGAYFQSAERMGVWMQAQAVFGVVSGALGIALVVGTGSIVWFCAAPVAGQLAALGWLLARAPGPIRGAWRAPWARVWRLLRALAPFAVAFVALTAYYKVDILLVERWRGEAEAGLYAAAYKFVDVAQALALVVATAVYPRLARWAAATFDEGVRARETPGSGITPHAGPESRGEPTRGSRWATTRVVELLLLAAVPAAGVLWLIRAPAISLLYGSGYGGATPVLGLLAPALPALALNVLGTFILAAARRMPAVATLYAAALLLNVALNAALVPKLGAGGAATAMLVSEWALAAGMLRVLHRRAAAAPGARAIGVALAAAAGVAIVALAGLPAAAAATAYVPGVVVLYAAMRVVPARELALVREAVLP